MRLASLHRSFRFHFIVKVAIVFHLSRRNSVFAVVFEWRDSVLASCLFLYAWRKLVFDLIFLLFLGPNLVFVSFSCFCCSSGFRNQCHVMVGLQTADAHHSALIGQFSWVFLCFRGSSQAYAVVVHIIKFFAGVSWQYAISVTQPATVAVLTFIAAREFDVACPRLFDASRAVTGSLMLEVSVSRRDKLGNVSDFLSLQYLMVIIETNRAERCWIYRDGFIKIEFAWLYDYHYVAHWHFCGVGRPTYVRGRRPWINWRSSLWRL